VSQIEVKNQNILAEAESSKDAAAFVGGLQRNAVRDISSELAATQLLEADASVSDLEATLPTIQNSITYDLTGLVATLRGDLSQRIDSRSSLRSVTSQRIDELLSIVSGSISTSFSSAQSTRTSIKSKFAAKRNTITATQSGILSTAVAAEKSRAAADYAVIMTQSSLVASTISQRVSAAVSAETSRVDSACTTALQARLLAIIAQNGANDGAAWYDIQLQYDDWSHSPVAQILDARTTRKLQSVLTCVVCTSIFIRVLLN
jgi:hypothetical protein